MQIGAAIAENSTEVPKEGKIDLPYHLAIPPLSLNLIDEIIL